MTAPLPTATMIDHVGFTVPDLDEAVGFFESLGFELLSREGPYGDEGDAVRRQLDVDPDGAIQPGHASVRLHDDA